LRPAPLAAVLADGSDLPGAAMLEHVLAVPGQTVCKVRFSIFIEDVAMGDARAILTRNVPSNRRRIRR
jgi:hypothetical protein